MSWISSSVGRDVRPSRRWFLLACASLGSLLPACDTSGNFTILGYSTATRFDTKYKTIRVPIFSNRTYFRGLEFDLTDAVVQAIEKTTPWKVVSGDADMELQGTILSFGKNIILVNPANEQREIEALMLVDVSWRDLRTGEILSKPPRRPGGPVLDNVPTLAEGPLPPTPPSGMIVPPLGPPSAPASSMGAPANMQDGSTVSPPVPLPPQPGQLGQVAVPLPGQPASMAALGQGALPARVPGIVIRATTTYLPELGESLTTARVRNCQRMAVNIVNMMEKPW